MLFLPQDIFVATGQDWREIAFDVMPNSERLAKTDHAIRVPAYDVAATVETGVSMEEILETYPSLKDWQIKLAPVYARAVPLKGRLERTPSNTPAGKFYIKRRLRPSSIAG